MLKVKGNLGAAGCSVCSECMDGWTATWRAHTCCKVESIYFSVINVSVLYVAAMCVYIFQCYIC